MWDMMGNLYLHGLVVYCSPFLNRFFLELEKIVVV